MGYRDGKEKMGIIFAESEQEMSENKESLAQS